MLTRKPRPKSELETTIEALLDRMTTFPAESEEYAKMTDQLVKLYKAKEQEAPRRVSPDTMVIVAGNLLGILVIVGYEKAHVVTSKALTFAGKLR